jgi:hypothetical protein
MPRIRCHYIDCVFLDDGYCGAAAIELDADVGCMTYKRMADSLDPDDDEWADDSVDELDDWDDIDLEEDDDDDLWIDDDDEDY